MRNFIAISLAVACCFQVAQGQCADFEQSFYELFEDIGEEDLALRVCVEARENTVIRLLTEERSATGGLLVAIKS